VRRRDFIALLGSGAAAWPLPARSQQPAIPTIGFLNYASRASAEIYVAPFRQGLKETGFVEGQNISIEYRWADGQYGRLPELAADLVGARVAAMLCGGSVSAVPCKAATTTIPIVFTSGEDPVTVGLVESLNRPGGNVTGVYSLTNGLEEKRLGLLRQLVPQASVIGAIANPRRLDAEIQTRDLQEAARALRQEIHIFNASSAPEIDTAFAAISQLRAGALIVGSDPSYIARRDQFVALAARYSVPTIYFQREFAESGGLISYGTNLGEGYRQAGIYVGQILKGIKPGDLPVLQSTKFELIINLKTAKTLGLTVSSGLLSIADEVIE